MTRNSSRSSLIYHIRWLILRFVAIHTWFWMKCSLLMLAHSCQSPTKWAHNTAGWFFPFLLCRLFLFFCATHSPVPLSNIIVSAAGARLLEPGQGCAQAIVFILSNLCIAWRQAIDIFDGIIQTNEKKNTCGPTRTVHRLQDGIQVCKLQPILKSRDSKVSHSY